MIKIEDLQNENEELYNMTAKYETHLIQYDRIEYKKQIENLKIN